MNSTSAFHAGEAAMHARLGIAERMAEDVSPVIREYLPEQHRQFFPLLPFVLLGSTDARDTSASVLAGAPGFVHSPDPRTLRIDALPARDDPLAARLVPGAAIGLLGLQPHTRRRNRANGIVTAVDATGFTLRVTQSFGNCPKYIQAREPRYVPGAQTAAAGQRFDTLPPFALDLVRNADTIFIATAHPDAGGTGELARAHGVDVSHRGGKPGFLKIGDDGAIVLPDYPGNRFFNTLGNLLLNPHAGIAIIDYDSGGLLQLAVDAEVVDDAALAAAHAGAERIVRFTVRHALWRPAALPLRWGPATLSPVLALLTP